MCQQAVAPVCLHRAARALLALTAESREFCLLAFFVLMEGLRPLQIAYIVGSRPTRNFQFMRTGGCGRGENYVYLPKNRKLA